MASTAARTARKRNPRGEGERLRSALMDAARELLLEHGNADALSIRNITARAGVSPTALYLHFADKEELLGAVCDEAFEEFGGYINAAAAAHAADPREQILAMGEAYVAFAQQRPGVYRILFATPGRFGMTPGPNEKDPGIQALDALIAAAAKCLPPGHDPRAAALQLWTAMHGYVSLRQVMPDFEWPSSSEFLHAMSVAALGAP
ncbi:MAG TPA: TetR/AcrR family transcriptional regulator [Solirubrobacteraceae bacterium]|nr:TetR/AcrR family transcriptional regulator [Solirubrobacteraceae bacterium]